MFVQICPQDIIGNIKYNLFKFEDPFILFYLRFHLVYKFQFNNCSIFYYCENMHHLKLRVGEDIGIFALTTKRVNNNKKSAIKDHCLLSGHVCSSDDFIVMNHTNLKV